MSFAPARSLASVRCTSLLFCTVSWNMYVEAIYGQSCSSISPFVNAIDLARFAAALTRPVPGLPRSQLTLCTHERVYQEQMRNQITYPRIATAEVTGAWVAELAARRSVWGASDGGCFERQSE